MDGIHLDTNTHKEINTHLWDLFVTHSNIHHLQTFKIVLTHTHTHTHKQTHGINCMRQGLSRCLKWAGAAGCKESHNFPMFCFIKQIFNTLKSYSCKKPQNSPAPAPLPYSPSSPLNVSPLNPLPLGPHHLDFPSYAPHMHYLNLWSFWRRYSSVWT